MFGGGFGGWGNGFGGGMAGAGYLGNTMNNNNNTDLIMQAINGTDSDVRLLATTLNADVNEVRSAISTINTGLANVGSQVGLTGLQVVNAIQAGDASLASQLASCCCENRLAICQQTNALQFCALKERELQNKIDTLTAANTSLRGQIDNANQTAAVAAMLAPIQKEVSEIKAAQPSTTTVQYPQLTAVPSYMLYGNGSYYGGYPYYYGGNGSIWA